MVGNDAHKLFGNSKNNVQILTSFEDSLDIEGHIKEKIDALPQIFFGELDAVNLTAPKMHKKRSVKTWYKFADETGDKIVNHVPLQKRANIIIVGW